MLFLDENLIKHSYCNCIRFKGLDRAYDIDKKVITDSLVHQLDATRKFVESTIKIDYHKEFENTVRDY